MSFWSGEKLEVELPSLINRFNPDMIDCNAYTLRVGHEAYVTPDHKVQNSLRHTIQTLKSDTGHIAIPPGQFGFLLTEEIIKVPASAMAFISLKAKIKFKGLINGSGFHVDPGFEGRLVFSVFNAGPNPVHLRQGQPLFLIWYADLDRVSKKIRKDPLKQFNIDQSLVNNISGEIQSAHGLSEKFSDFDRLLHRVNIQVNLIYVFIIAVFVYASKDWLLETFNKLIKNILS